MVKIKCKYCGKGDVVKNGVRKNMKQEVIRYRCKDCNKTFSLKEMSNKTYNASIILKALSYYNQGYTFDSVSKMVNQRFKVNTYPQLINSWFNEYKYLWLNRISNLLRNIP